MISLRDTLPGASPSSPTHTHSVSSLAYKSKHCKCLRGRGACGGRGTGMPHVASWAYNKDMAIELRPRHVSRDVCRNQSAQTNSKIIKNNPRMHTHMREKGRERGGEGGCCCLPVGAGKQLSMLLASCSALSFINKICINLINPGSLSAQARDRVGPQKALFRPCAHLLVAVATRQHHGCMQHAVCSMLHSCGRLAGRFVIYRFTGKAVCHKTPLSHPKTHK